MQSKAAAAAAAAADTSLAELNGSLLREEEGLVAGRGLITGYTGEAELLLLLLQHSVPYSYAPAANADLAALLCIDRDAL
jgi:hypothetical protein